MKKLIKMYNEKYGNTLGIIDDDFNKEQMYRIYYFIKNNCDDKDIQERLAKIKLDKPKTLEQQLTKLESENNKDIKKYVDDNTIIHPLPVYKKVESPTMIMYMVNIMDLKKLTTYGEDGSILITKQKLLDSVALLAESANNARISINTNNGTYYMNKMNPTVIKVYKQTVEDLE